MDGEDKTELLDMLSEQVEKRFDECGEDRQMFFLGLRRLQQGKIEEAVRVFRRAARQCPAPFSVMARMAQGRCEVVRGRQGVALRVFRNVANSEAPANLRQMAWMEVADLARLRQDQELLNTARDAISVTG